MKSATTPEEIDPHGARRLWRAALARYADDCRQAVTGLRTDAKLHTFRDALDALHDLEEGGQQLAWLCECCGLDVEYTRSALVAWLAEKCDIDATPATQQDAAPCNRPSQTPLDSMVRRDPRYTAQSNQAACHAV